MNREEQWAIGEWVKGKTKNGELIHGFIESVDSLQDTVKVYVVECDNDMTVGKSVVTPNQWVEIIPVATIDAEGQIRDLIDLALATNDKAWFMELSRKAKSVEKSSQGRENKSAGNQAFRNRLGTSAIWE